MNYFHLFAISLMLIIKFKKNKLAFTPRQALDAFGFRDPLRSTIKTRQPVSRELILFRRLSF